MPYFDFLDDEGVGAAATAGAGVGAGAQPPSLPPPKRPRMRLKSPKDVVHDITPMEEQAFAAGEFGSGIKPGDEERFKKLIQESRLVARAADRDPAIADKLSAIVNLGGASPEKQLQDLAAQKGKQADVAQRKLEGLRQPYEPQRSFGVTGTFEAPPTPAAGPPAPPAPPTPEPPPGEEQVPSIPRYARNQTFAGAMKDALVNEHELAIQAGRMVYDVFGKYRKDITPDTQGSNARSMFLFGLKALPGEAQVRFLGPWVREHEHLDMLYRESGGQKTPEIEALDAKIKQLDTLWDKLLSNNDMRSFGAIAAFITLGLVLGPQMALYIMVDNARAGKLKYEIGKLNEDIKFQRRAIEEKEQFRYRMREEQAKQQARMEEKGVERQLKLSDDLRDKMFSWAMMERRNEQMIERGVGRGGEDVRKKALDQQINILAEMQKQESLVASADEQGFVDDKAKAEAELSKLRTKLAQVEDVLKKLGLSPDASEPEE